MTRTARRWPEETGVGLLEIDGHGRIASVNDEMSALTGYAPIELRGRRVEALFATRVGRQDDAGRTRAQPIAGFRQSWVRHRDGHDVPVTVQFGPAREGRSWFIVGADDEPW